jgi:hypothetical protein
METNEQQATGGAQPPPLPDPLAVSSDMARIRAQRAADEAETEIKLRAIIRRNLALGRDRCISCKKANELIDGRWHHAEPLEECPSMKRPPSRGVSSGWRSALNDLPAPASDQEKDLSSETYKQRLAEQRQRELDGIRGARPRRSFGGS